MFGLKEYIEVRKEEMILEAKSLVARELADEWNISLDELR